MINFTERNYLTVLQSYNEALLRKKNLEMTSATLKVLNEPTYPISSNSTNRKQIVIAACAVSFLIIVALLLLVEMLDRTLRDASRTRRVTGFKVIGAIPNTSPSRYGGLTKTYVQLSVKELSNSLLRFLTKRKSPGVFIINLFSTSDNSGEEELGNLICGYMQSRMLNARFITYGVDFNTDSTQFLLAKSITDFYTLQGEDVLIVAYPPLSTSNIPSALLHDANANILVASADRGWKTIDKQLCEQLTQQLSKTDVPFRICLTNANRDAVEDFTGQLPPHTLLRRIGYRLSQLSLTEKSYSISEEKPKKQQTRTMTNKVTAFHLLLAAQFALIAASMFVNIKIGLFSMVLILLFTTICLIQLGNDERTNWKPGQNIMTYFFIVWLLFYILEILNPNNVMAAWNINLTPYALTPLICAFVVPIVIRTKKILNYY